jgi:hypothetical protein
VLRGCARERLSGRARRDGHTDDVVVERLIAEHATGNATERPSAPRRQRRRHAACV